MRNPDHAGSAGDQAPPAPAPDDAADVRRAASPLAPGFLPDIDTAVPLNIHVSQGEQFTDDIAVLLIQEGLIDPLATSTDDSSATIIQTALERLRANSACGDLHYFQLYWFVTDDINAVDSPYHQEILDMRKIDRDDRPVALGAGVQDHTCLAFGDAMRKLLGSGKRSYSIYAQLLRLIDLAAKWAPGVYTPGECYGLTQVHCWRGHTDESELLAEIAAEGGSPEEYNLITRTELFARMSEILTGVDLVNADPTHLLAPLVSSKLPRSIKDAAQWLANALEHAARARPQPFTLSGARSGYILWSTLLLHSENDEMIRVFDQARDDDFNSGEGTDLVGAFLLRTSTRKKLRRDLAHLTICLDILGAVDNLIHQVMTHGA